MNIGSEFKAEWVTEKKRVNLELWKVKSEE
jgi:hypothetical protein